MNNEHSCINLLTEAEESGLSIRIIEGDNAHVLDIYTQSNDGSFDMITTVIKYCPYCGKEL